MKQLKLHLLFCSPFYILGNFQTLNAQSNLNDNGQSHTINANGSYQDFIIPVDTDLDRLEFIMEGGDGGEFRFSGSCKADGGDGSRVTMVFRIGTSGNDLRPGGTIRFIPGRKGFNQFNDGGAGGGGGSAVLYKKPNVTITATNPSTSFAYQNSNWIILGVAGGGGGAQGVYIQSSENSGSDCKKDAGSGASTTTSGTSGGGSNDGGTNGNGGETGNDTRDGGAGAGYLSDGDQDGTDSKNGKKGGFTGGNGGTCSNCKNGGFGYGGGGGGKNGNSGGGGGGGGYSGGGGGNNGSGFANNGGGGGSFVNSTDIDAFKNIENLGNTSNPQHGFITYAFRNSGGIEANCKDITVTLDNGTATLTPLQVNNESVVGPGEQMALFFVSVLDLGVGMPVEVPLPDVSYDCSALGMHEVTLKVLSSSGQTANCTANIEVIDDVAPTVICETFGGIFAPVGLGRDFTLEINNLETSSTDACGTIVNKTLSQTLFTCDDIGNHTVTLFVEDNNGNVGTCTATVGVTAIDQPLQLTCPANITLPLAPGSCSTSIVNGLAPINLKGPCDASLNYAITETTNNGNPSVLETGQGAVGSVSFQIGTTRIDYELSAPNGQQRSCSFTVTLSPNDPPSAVCQNITLQLDDNGQATLTPSQIDNGSTFCNASSLSLSQNSFDCNRLGNNTVELLIQEGALVSSCLANVQVVDNTPPVLDCIDITIQLNADGVTSITPADVQENSYDNCGLIVNQSLNKTTFNCAEGGSSIVTLSAEDPEGNQSSCTVEVVVQDNVVPEVVCKNLTIQLDESGEAAFYESFLELSSYDACGLVPIVEDPLLEFDCDDLGVHSLPFSRLDNQGNIGTCNASVIIEDRLAPTITCQDVTISLLDNSAPSEGFTLETDVGLVSISDNCTASANNFVTSSGFSIHCNNIGDNGHTLLVTDESGNYASCSIVITVVDDTRPMANCKDVTVQLDDDGNGSLLPSDVDDNSIDHCGIQSLALSQNSFDCAETGANSVTLIVTDNNGNSATCSAMATVEDNIAPAALCQPVTVYLSSPTLSGEQLGAGSTDNCTSPNDLLFHPIVFTGEPLANPLTFDCNQVGVIDILGVDVFDESFNRTSCITTITVIDDIAPEALCKNATLQLDANGNTSLQVSDIDHGSSDECRLESVALSQSSFDCTNIGMSNLVLTVTDVNNNISTCSATVTIEDTIQPTITCQDAITLNTAPGRCEVAYILPIPIADDNCGVTILRYRHRLVNSSGSNISGQGWSSWYTNSEIILGIGNWKIQWQAKDPVNNQNKCYFIIEIQDNEAPNPVCLQPTITFNGEPEMLLSIDQLWDEVNSSDNCNEVLSVNFTPTLLTCDQIGTQITIPLFFEDAAGNPASCLSNVTIGGLPCSWQANDINCPAGTQADYDPIAGSFSLSSEGCYDPNFYSNSDSQGIISQELCGDGEIIAQVSSFDGDAWAGIFMRETNDPDAKMLQLAINNTGLAQRQLRQSTGSLAYKHLFQNQGKHWLRLTRSGNQFGAFLSLDGINWTSVLMTNIPMTNCIQIGLFLSNSTPGSLATAWFDQVQIKPPTGSNALQTPNFQFPIADSQIQPNFSVYPNPTSGAINLVLHAFMDQPVELRVFNQNGQILMTKSYGEGHSSIEKLWLEHLQNGLYLLQVKVGAQVFSKKINVIH